MRPSVKDGPSSSCRLPVPPLRPPLTRSCLHFLLSPTETTGSFSSTLPTPMLPCASIARQRPPPGAFPLTAFSTHPLGCQELNNAKHSPPGRSTQPVSHTSLFRTPISMAGGGRQRRIAEEGVQELTLSSEQLELRGRRRPVYRGTGDKAELSPADL